MHTAISEKNNGHTGGCQCTITLLLLSPCSTRAQKQTSTISPVATSQFEAKAFFHQQRLWEKYASNMNTMHLVLNHNERLRAMCNVPSPKDGIQSVNYLWLFTIWDPSQDHRFVCTLCFTSSMPSPWSMKILVPDAGEPNVIWRSCQVKQAYILRSYITGPA